jgi:RES domain-containing protein
LASQIEPIDPDCGRAGLRQGMIRAWRLTKARYAGDLTGQWAAREGQRWNQPGQRAVYLGLTPEITVLEVLVHLNGVLTAPLVLSGYEVPAAPGLISEADPAVLPEGWNAIPHGQASAAFGGDWLRDGQELGLVLPSVVVPQARNLLLNPLHPAMAQVALAHKEPFQLDTRLG